MLRYEYSLVSIVFIYAYKLYCSIVRPSGCSRSTFIWSEGETYWSDNTNCTKHLVGIEGVKVPSEPSNKRMILESNLLAKLNRRKNIKSWIKYLKEALATIFTKKVYVLEIGK
jgi:hypothetical protein